MTDKTKVPGAKGKARFELGRGGKTLAVHVDRQGFRRLVETLERLAETGERQMFEKSGRRSSGAKTSRSVDGNAAPDKLVFHIDDGEA